MKLKRNKDGSLTITGVVATLKCDAEGAEALRDALLDLYPVASVAGRGAGVAVAPRGAARPSVGS